MASIPELEGTILTEGRGTGRGTRFATPLSTRQLVTGGAERGITGGKGGISADAALNLNPAGAMVRPRATNPMEVKAFTSEGSGVSPDAISKVGDVVSRAVFNYADRVHTAQAEEAAIAFNERVREAFFGVPDKGVKGFHDLRGAAAIKGRGQFFESIDKLMANTLEELEPAVKQKVLAKMHSIRDTTLNRAASHVVAEQNNYETQLKFTRANDIARELAVDSSNVEGLQQKFFGIYGEDIAGASRDWDSSAATAAQTHYRNVVRRDGYGASLPALRKYIDAVSPTLTEKGRDIVEDYYEAEEKQEEAAVKRAEADNKRLEAEMVTEVYVDALAVVDKDPTKAKSFSEVVALFPELAKDPPMAHSVLRYADSLRAPDAAAKVDRFNTALMEMVYPMLESGTGFPDKSAFTRHLVDTYGVHSSTEINQLWAHFSEPLKDDERLLKGQATILDRRLRNAFGIPPPPPAPPIGGSPEAWQEWSIATATYSKQGNKYPVDYQQIQNKIAQIVNNRAIPPMEREQQMRDMVAAEAAKIGAPSQLSEVENIEALTSYYRIPAYAQKLQTEAANPPTNDDVVYPNYLDINENGDIIHVSPTAPATSKATPHGELSSVEVRFLSKSGAYNVAAATREKLVAGASKRGIGGVRFVTNYPIGGVSHTGYIGMVPQEDGSVVLQALSMQEVKKEE